MSNNTCNGIFLLNSDNTITLYGSTGYKKKEKLKIQKPTVIVESYTYNGSAQGPTITNLDTNNTIVTNATQTDAGSYTLTIALKDKIKTTWNDNTIEDLVYNYTISKATGSISANPIEINLNKNNKTITSTISTNGDGAITVTNNNPNTYNVSYNSSTKIITITDNNETSGSGTITITLSASNNYTEDSLTLNVAASFKPDLVAWTSGTDAQIQDMLDAYYNGILTLDEIKSVWSIGDVRNVALSAMSATGVGESHRAQSVQMEILDFDHDDLTNSIGNKTKALISIGQKNCLMDLNTSAGIELGSGNTEHGTINYTNSSTQWSNSERRTWCNNIYYKALPSTFKSMVKQVNKLVSDKQGNISVSADYCWFYSEIEVSGEVEHSFAGEGTQYELFNMSVSNRYKNPPWSENSSSDIWLLRSINKYEKYNYVYLDGTISAYINIEWDAGIAPAMCL